MDDTSIWTEKYRPKTFDEVVGQDDIVKQVKSLTNSMNINHLLFAGPAVSPSCLRIDVIVGVTHQAGSLQGVGVSSLLRHVPHVVGVRSQEKMDRVTARGSIAVMKDLESFGNLLAKMLVGPAVG